MNIEKLYTLSKRFVDTYEHEEHEKRRAVPDPAQRAFPPEWSDDKQKAYKQLASAVFEGGNFDKIQKAAKSFVNICNREEQEQPKRKWSPEKQRAYGKLLDCAIGRTSCETICNAAIEFAEVCKPEREKPKTGEVYCDIFGNQYISLGVYDEEPVKKSFVMLIYLNELSSSKFFTVPLEEFMNPTFKKE